jgi:predicted aspartyl protease
MRRVTIFAVVFAAIFSARSWATEPIASIPYRMDFNGWYTVDININGKGPYTFIVDTGATLTIIYKNTSDSQEFAPADEPARRILGIIGAQTLPAVTIGDLDIGGIAMNDHVGVIIPDWDTPGPKPHGVLGLDFLTRYTVLFNTEKKQIELYNPNNPPTDIMAGMSRTRLRLSTFNKDYGGLYTINLRIAGRFIPCIVDLGADGTLINYSAMRRLMGGIYVGPSRSAGSTTGSKIRDVFGDESAARAIRAGPVRIGSARWGKHTFVVYNAGIFQELGVHRKGYGLLGADLLKDRNFILDFANERFYVTRKPAEGAS